MLSHFFNCFLHFLFALDSSYFLEFPCFQLLMIYANFFRLPSGSDDKNPSEKPYRMDMNFVQIVKAFEMRL